MRGYQRRVEEGSVNKSSAICYRGASGSGLGFFPVLRSASGGWTSVRLKLVHKNFPSPADGLAEKQNVLRMERWQGPQD